MLQFINLATRLFLQVQNYFNSFPVEKVPKLNSAGEQYRNKMLTLQLPQQDLHIGNYKILSSKNRVLIGMSTESESNRAKLLKY